MAAREVILEANRSEDLKRYIQQLVDRVVRRESKAEAKVRHSEFVRIRAALRRNPHYLRSKARINNYLRRDKRREWASARRAMFGEEEFNRRAKLGRNYRASKRLSKNRRRARIKANLYERVSGKFWAAAIVLWDGRCAYCLQPTEAPEMDHFVPISVGGAHAKHNLVPACKRCNASKKAQHPFEFLHDIGRGHERLGENVFTLQERLVMLAGWTEP